MKKYFPGNIFFIEKNNSSASRIVENNKKVDKKERKPQKLWK